MDLERLKIDRSARPTKQVRRFPLGRLLLLAALVLGAVLFGRPVWRMTDRLRLPEVQVVQVRRQHPAAVGAVQGKAANGYIVAARRAALSADTPGRIVEINVEEGSVVKQGDVVARLFSEEYAADVEQARADREVAEAEVVRAQRSEESSAAEARRLTEAAAASREDVEVMEARLALAKRDLERIGGLVEQGIASERELDEAQTGVDDVEAQRRALESRQRSAEAAAEAAVLQEATARAALQVAEAQVQARIAAETRARATLDKTEVRAPFDGIVVLKDAEVGEVVSPNSQGGSNARGSVCTMVDFDSLEVQADVPETSLAAVKLDAAAKIYLDAYPDQPYRGRTSRIWPTANRQKATVEVRIKFEEPDEKLRPEMGVRVVFLEQETEPDPATTQITEQLLVPTECIYSDGGGRKVFVLERDRVHARAIQTGETRAGRTAVQSGLREGERVVVNPPPSLEDDDRVRVQESQ